MKSIFETIKTQEDIGSVLSDVSRLEALLFEKRHKNRELYDLLESEFDYKFSEIIASWLTTQGIKGKDRPTKVVVQESLSLLRKTLDEVNSFKIALAFKPSKKFINRIAQWVKTNFGEKIVLDIDYEKNLLGGVVVSFNGKYADYSLEKALPEAIKKMNL